MKNYHYFYKLNMKSLRLLSCAQSLLLILIVFLLFFLWFLSSLLSFYYYFRLKLFVHLFFEHFFSIANKPRGFIKFDKVISWLGFSYLSVVMSNFVVAPSFLFFLKGQGISLFLADFTYVIFISESWIGRFSSETTFVCYFFWLTADYLQVDYSNIEVNEKLKNWLWLLATLSF